MFIYLKSIEGIDKKISTVELRFYPIQGSRKFSDKIEGRIKSKFHVLGALYVILTVRIDNFNNIMA